MRLLRHPLVGRDIDGIFEHVLASTQGDLDAVEPYPVTVAQGDLRLATIDDPVKFYRVEKMKFAGKRPNLDRTAIVYNSNITVTGIPLEAYDYVVNGKPAIDWVMERQAVTTDTASGIVNDANRYAIEVKNDPAYPFKLLCRVITISLETMKIVKALPALDVADGEGSTGPAMEQKPEEPVEDEAVVLDDEDLVAPA